MLRGQPSAKRRPGYFNQWATTDPTRQFHDLFNLVANLATLRVAWLRVRTNRGTRSAGVDGVSCSQVEQQVGEEPFLRQLRDRLKNGTYRPEPVRERAIPKKGGKVRRLGIPTVTDRVVQMALKLVLEPIFEPDQYRSSYAYRPGRRAQDAVAEIVHYINNGYTWVVEGDIEGCFDNVDHQVLMGLVHERITDKKVLRLVRAFLRAGVVEQHGGFAASLTGTPQSGVISPLLANIYLSVLDRHFAKIWDEQMSPAWRRQYRRRMGRPNYRMIRYADDFVHGTRNEAQQVKQQIAEIVARDLKMTLSDEKTLITHIDIGFNFLGFRIQRKQWNGKPVVLTWPAKDALAVVMHKIKQWTGWGTTSMALSEVLRKINPILRGWAAYFRYGVSKKTFSYLGWYAWWRMIGWIRRKHPYLTWKQIRRRYYGADRITEADITLYNPAKMRVERYRFRGQQICTPYNIDVVDPDKARFRRTNHDDAHFVAQVSELVS